MRPKKLSPFFAVALIAALVIPLIPQTYAGTGSQASRQDSQSRPRRGKNGSRVSDHKTSNPSGGDSKARAPANPDNKVNEHSDDVESARQENASEATASQYREAEKPAAADSSETQDKNQRRREPAPFDRPPLASGSKQDSPSQPSQPSVRTTPQYPEQSQPQTSRRSQSGAESRRQPPVIIRDNDRAPSSTGDVDDERTDRSGGPPVLRRPNESQSQPQERRRDSYPDDQTDRRRNPTDSSAPGDDEPITLNATLVNIPVLVSDRSGRYVPQLDADDFVIYEDGVQQEVAFFGNERVPFKVALMLDVSPSVQGNLEDIQDAAIEFVRQLRAQDEVMVISFDRHVRFLTGFTNDRRHLEYAIRSTNTGSGTSVYDAVYETVARRLRGVDGRKALILFSDGEDTTSRQASYDDAVEIVTESDVLVYGLRYPGTNMRVNPWPNTRNPIPQLPIPLPFPFPWPRRRGGNFTDMNFNMNFNGAMVSSAANTQSWPQRDRHRDFMEDITTAGGGPVYDAERISDLSRLASKIAEELRHVYMVSYYPTNSLKNGGYRRIRINVRGRSEIAVRHRRGYNAQDMGSRAGT